MNQLKKITICALVLCQLFSCSSAGGIYKEGDDKHGEFSIINTLLIGAAAVVAVDAARSSGGGGNSYENPKWDYLQASGTWACRNASNGQFMAKEKCANQPKVDNWTNN